MADSTTTDVALYSDAQNRFLSTMLTVVSPLSLIGSSLILYVVWKDRRKLWRNSYDRIMVGLSIFDILSSSGFCFTGPWSISEDVPFVVGAKASSPIPCSLAGFLLHMTVGSILYTASLMIYFVLFVRLEWPHERIAKRVEPWLHAVSIIVTVGTGVVAVLKEYMNPYAALPGVCYIGGYPPDCGRSSSIPCIRGSGSAPFVMATAVLVFATILLVATAMILLVLKVRATELRLAQYLVGDSQRVPLERTHRTAHRGLAYVGAFGVAYVLPTVFLCILTEKPVRNRGVAFFLSLSIVLHVSLQGFFNGMVYLRPKWSELTQQPGGHLYGLGQCLRRVVRVGKIARRRKSNDNNTTAVRTDLSAAAVEPTVPLGNLTTAEMTHHDAWNTSGAPRLPEQHGNNKNDDTLDTTEGYDNKADHSLMVATLTDSSTRTDGEETAKEAASDKLLTSTEDAGLLTATREKETFPTPMVADGEEWVTSPTPID